MSQKKRAEGSGSIFRLIHVPSMMYGRRILTGSVKIDIGALNNPAFGSLIFEPFVVDDGRGSLYLSGSFESTGSSKEFRSVPWNKVGNIFYSEGIIVFTDPAIGFFDQVALGNLGFCGDPTKIISVSFQGEQRINTQTIMCRLGPAQGNASNNPSYTRVDDRGTADPSDDRRVLKAEKPVTYVTAVGLYNEDRQLVAVAKIAQPIRKREKDPVDIRLKMDY